MRYYKNEKEIMVSKAHDVSRTANGFAKAIRIDCVPANRTRLLAEIESMHANLNDIAQYIKAL